MIIGPIECLIYALISKFIWIFALYKINKEYNKDDLKKIAIICVILIFVVLLSMYTTLPINYPIFLILLPALIAILGSPELSIVLFSIILFIQAIFGLGGITTYGANIFNIAIVGSYVGYYSFNYLKNKMGNYPSIAISAWISYLASAIFLMISAIFINNFPFMQVLKDVLIAYSIAGIIISIATVFLIFIFSSAFPDIFSFNNENNSLK